MRTCVRVRLSILHIQFIAKLKRVVVKVVALVRERVPAFTGSLDTIQARNVLQIKQHGTSVRTLLHASLEMDEN